ncbi:hypothetical protein PYW08_014010 [Mythimna loreyi]|uniref:Uncharacterized protein n=1 Tax=Mythimna loreyi TaxID=667449 RepID=A0ACC2R696_9NEOP|nr:hypothetical protein PYW08_014010 [Mythimna loreyi]
MDEIQVDPKLFVTCRLCLEDLGQYQIVPSVQQQIKYCFDIDVEPFDGLPQLVCSKCKEILNRFHTIKTTFCEKQTDLRKKVIKKDEIFCIQPQQDTVSSSQQAPETVEPHLSTNPIINEPCTSKKKKSKRRRLFRHSSSSSDLESEQSFKSIKSQKKKSPRRRGKIPMPWEADYKKSISCKLCNTVWSSRKALAVHNRSHELLRAKYKNIFNRQCTVRLIKIDNRPNLTGLNTVVVHSSNKIIEPGNSPYFSTIYSKEDEPASTSDFRNNDVHNEDENKCSSQESSDSEERIAYNPIQRKRRIMSRSSNETVVIESNTNKVLSDEEDSKSAICNSIHKPLLNEQCINIVDSSDSESNQGNMEKSGKVKQPVEAKLNDYKIIQGIITMCVNSCLNKKNESSEADMLYMNVDQNKKRHNMSNESQLIHKVLSIGRKIINKQGFNCTGLLRYMEQKNLGIVWMAKPHPLLHSKDTNYIRILTRLCRDPILDDETAWIRASENTQKKPISLAAMKKSIKKALGNVTVTSDSTVTNIESNIATSMLANIETSQPEPVNDQANLDSLPAMLSYVDSKASTSDSKKLLNANPVANPKQLPKKLGLGNDSRSNKTIVQQTVVSQPPTNDDDNYCLPIITSTTSLATVPSKEQTQDVNQKTTVTSEDTNKIETPAAPRIKVKPVSELMSERTLDRMKEQSVNVSNSNMLVSQIENAWPHQHQMNVFVPNIATPMLVASPPLLLQMPTLNTEPAYQPVPGPITSQSNTKPEYVILDTNDFPNTRTESPIKYVMNLMQLHNIHLLDPNEPISLNFICLIRFKVVFKQDYQRDSPVILCLSLSCLKNTFCLQVRDRNQEIIDMTKISANWQWEILQTYRGDVSNKVLQNARKSGQETYDLTNKFFCLLKSIKCRKP